MPSRKKVSSKRVTIPRRSDFSNSFLKDWVRLSRSGRYDMTRLKDAMALLVANNEPLGPEWSDHPLVGQWKDCRECHIGGDFLLIYQITGNKADGSDGSVKFLRAGTHSELFE